LQASALSNCVPVLDVAESFAPPVNWMPQATNRASSANAAEAGYVVFTNLNSRP
jgi:hypothetical protein